MAEEYGMKLWLDLTVKNWKETEKEIKERLKNVPMELVLQTAKTAQTAKQTAESVAGTSATATQTAESMSSMAKGIGKTLGVLGAIAYGVNKIFNKMVESSPYLRGILDIFDRSFMLFIRPFADFVAQILRPLALMLLKLSISWLKFSRTDTGKSAVSGITQLATGPLGMAVTGMSQGMEELGKIDWSNLAEEIRTRINGAWNTLKEGVVSLTLWIVEGVKSLTGIDLLDVGRKIGLFLTQTIPEFFTKKIPEFISSSIDKMGDFGAWLWKKLTGVWNYTQDLGIWLWSKLQSVWTYTSDFGKFLWDQLQTIWNYKKDFGSWLWNALISVWTWAREWDFGGWLWNKMADAVSSGLNVLSNLGQYILDWAKNMIGIGGGSTRTTVSNVQTPNTIASTRNSQVTVNNTYNVTAGMSSSANYFQIASQLSAQSRMSELDLRSRGLSL